MNKCSICESNTNLINHHLSYEPEIIVIVCKYCHYTMHGLCRLSSRQRNIIDSWIEQYGHEWENGREKYQKSKHRKNYNKTDKYINYNKEYQFLKLDSKKMARKIENMERKLKIVEGVA